jgi:hypothetical protein
VEKSSSHGGCESMRAGLFERTRRCPALTFGLAALLLVAVLLAVAACSASEAPAPSDYSTSSTGGAQGMLEDGIYQFRVDRVLESTVPGPPTELLAESLYVPLGQAAVIRVVVSSGGAQVSLDWDARDLHLVSQSRRPDDGQGHIWYELPMGRFVVWTTAEGLQGEFSEYGSGVNYIVSVRGLLVRDSSQDPTPPGEENLTIEELVRTVKHTVYWAGDSFEARPLTGCRVSVSGVVTLEYGSLGGSSGDSAASPLISVYEYLPSELDPAVLSGIQAQLTNPRKVQGERGTYTLYDAALNGMPMLEVVRGDIHISVVDVKDGDVGIMVRVADALVEATD